MAKQAIYLLKYNNYYNRQIKRFDTFQEYMDSGSVVASYFDINFNPNDNITATQILNYNEDVDPDYAIILNQDVENPNDFTRWFILETKRERGGQYRINLYRDTVADYYNDILYAPTFIEKATISDINDPAIFNNENMSFNQIKTWERTIKDESGVAWIVGYVPRNTLDGTTITLPSSVPTNPDITLNSLSEWDYYSLIDKEVFFTYDWSATLRYYSQYPYFSKWRRVMDSNGNFEKEYYVDIDRSNLNDTILVTTLLTSRAFENYAANTNYISNNVKTNISYDPSHINILYLEGQTIYDASTNLSWKIKVKYRKIMEAPYQNTTLNEWFKSNLNTNVVGNLQNFTPNYTVEMFIVGDAVTITLEPIVESIEVTLPSALSRRHLVTAPYDMFCIPYGKIDVQLTSSPLVPFETTNAEAAIAFAQQIGSQIAQSDIYDIQLLPYCPCRHLLSTSTQSLRGLIKAYLDTSVSILRDSQNTFQSVIIWCDSSEISITLNNPTNMTMTGGRTAIDRKISNETDLYRLNSPNYSGAFDISAAKNDGLKTFSVTCNYKPFNPYIKVAPAFANLYGQDFGDARGLICGGDFSLSRISDAWANYERNNVNYQKIFDRQIENMEVNNSVQRINDIAGIVTGAVGAGVSGASMGVMAGGAVGGVIGGVAGAASSAVGGGVDLYLKEKLRNEAIDYAKDQFGYNLQNIQALPYSLSKVGAFNNDNKIFPFLEYYTCTEKEKKALRDKLKYNGMTIMRVGRIIEFIQVEESYIKGKVIRLDNIHDYDVSKAISEEIYKGVFI